VEITRNGAPPAALQPAMVTSSWMREDLPNGRRRFRLYAMQVPVMRPEPQDMQTRAHRLAGNPAVIGEATIDVMNLEVARILHAAIGEMLAKQPPEILTLGGTK